LNEKRSLDVIAPAGEPGADARAPSWLDFELDLADEESPPEGAVLVNAVGVRLDTTRIVEHDGGDAVYARGARVVCEGASGVACGTVAVPSRRLLSKEVLPRILRTAAFGDRATEAQLRAREQAVLVEARRVARSTGLAIKAVRAEAVAGGQRFLVYFASEEKFPFHELLSALGAATRERVELRQVGLRDAAKVIGGVGPCGLQLCCNTFLADFAPVTIKMAKDQGLGVNPQKLSGVCGRLFCCLVYEEAAYRAQRRLVPNIGDRIQTARGAGKVREVDILEMRVKVSLDRGGTLTVPVAEIEPPSG